MNPDQLITHYDAIADAPDAVSRLRRFILDLAVRGKLVPQDANDEPAPELLKRIEREKERLVRSGSIRTPKPTPPVSEVPFPLPANWSWSQIAEIGAISPRNEAADGLEASFVPMPMIAAEYGVSNDHEVRAWGTIKKGYTHFAEGDVGLAKITPCFENGKSTVFRNLTGGIGSGTTELHIVRPVLVSEDYVLLFLKSPFFIESGIAKMTGTAGQKRVPATYFANTPFPLPPLAEQHRIVARVDELMAICDQLETARAHRETTRDHLTTSTFARLQVPDPDTFQTDVCFALDTLPELTARPDQIKHFRQTILDLAVRGKLVPQDPNDEPATTVAAEHEFTEADSGDGSPPWDADLPETWIWAATNDVCEAIVDCPHSTPTFIPTGVACLDTNSIKSGTLIKEKLRFVSELTYADRVGRLVPRAGDLVFAREGSVGSSFVIPDGMKCCLGQRVMLFRPRQGVFPRYFGLALSSPPSLNRLLGLYKGIGAKQVNVGDMRKARIPLPPVAEQHRIVDRVDELMAICDQLEASLTTSATTRSHLLEALLADALSPIVPALDEALV